MQLLGEVRFTKSLMVLNLGFSKNNRSFITHFFLRQTQCNVWGNSNCHYCFISYLIFTYILSIYSRILVVILLIDKKLQEIFNIKIWNFTDFCYKEEITPQSGKICKDHEYNGKYGNICDGSKTDCVLKGKEKCHSDPNCHGIMYNGGSWGQTFKGVKVCKTKTLVAKPDKAWNVYLKCHEGKFWILKKGSLNIPFWEYFA